jgi:hypothetical protein
VQRDHDRRAGGAGVQHFGDGVVIGGVDFGDPRRAIGVRRRDVAGDRRPVRYLRHRAGRGGIAVAVDHQPRKMLRHRSRIQARGKRPAEPGHPDVPADMPPPLALGQAEIAQLPGDCTAGMIA